MSEKNPRSQAQIEQTAKATEAASNAAAARRAAVQAQLESSGIPPLEVSAARREAARAELAERELAVHKDRYLDTEQARADVIAAFSLVKTRLLGVPTLVGQRLPELADQVVPVVDELIRDALVELSSRGEADDGVVR